jgi:hypothetical protein
MDNFKQTGGIFIPILCQESSFSSLCKYIVLIQAKSREELAFA